MIDSENEQDIQQELCRDGGRDHLLQPSQVKVPRSRPANHDNQPLWTQDKITHGEQVNH